MGSGRPLSSMFDNCPISKLQESKLEQAEEYQADGGDHE